MLDCSIYKTDKFIYGFSTKGTNIVSKIINKLNISPLVVSSDQVHGAGVAEYDGVNLFYKGVDSLVTNKKNVMLTIRTADCVPIVLFSKLSLAASVVHAGRKGTMFEIIPETIKKMQVLYGVEPEDVIAHIGPCIRKCCYEVGSDVVAELNDNEFVENILSCDHNNKYKLDLVEYNIMQMVNAGVKRENIVDINHCTACLSDLYYSYRKNKDTERMYSFVVRVV